MPTIWTLQCVAMWLWSESYLEIIALTSWWTLPPQSCSAWADPATTAGPGQERPPIKPFLLLLRRRGLCKPAPAIMQPERTWQRQKTGGKNSESPGRVTSQRSSRTEVNRHSPTWSSLQSLLIFLGGDIGIRRTQWTSTRSLLRSW